MSRRNLDGISPEGYARTARARNVRQLRCMLRDARKKFRHNGRHSFAGREARKAITAAEREFVRRGMRVPAEGQEMES